MSGADPRDRGLAAYADLFRRISPQTLAELGPLVTSDMHFRDPFNDVRGLDRVLRVFRKMFEDADDIRFEVRDVLRNGDRGVLVWRFWCRPRRLGKGDPWQIDGVSEVRLTPDGRIREHLDHWDAASQLYERLPVLGSLLRLVKRRLQV